MTYLFSGFFGVCEEAILRMALKRWSDCNGRVISQPFVGIGISCHGEFGEAESVKADLPTFSTLFPEVDFVWIEVECFGSVCDYCGFVCRNGQTILSEDWPADVDTSEQLLRRLLSYLGVEGTFFEPFQRGYFANT
jgi:hypothetical protein